MHLPSTLAKKLPIHNAARNAVATTLHQVPHLISDRSLDGGVSQLARHTEARFGRGHSPAIETITMPKKGLGPRPISLLSPETRTLYDALVEKLKPGLPSPSRAQPMSDHQEFGVPVWPDRGVQIVDFDIAACYEYIDHNILAEELLIQTLDADSVSALMGLLLDMFPRGMGIPQAMDSSHLLGDAYLNQIERDMSREGYDVHRFADDFRIVTESQSQAFEAIEHAMAIARRYGLVLADKKTNIRSAWDVREEIIAKEDAFQKYNEEAAEQLTAIEFMQIGYDDWSAIETEPDPQDVNFMALSRVIEDWATGDANNYTVHTHFGTRALQALQASDERLKDEWLVQVVAKEPVRLFNVGSYLVNRHENLRNWSTLRDLTRLPRQSPWARLWMARLADSLEPVEAESRDEVISWANGLLDDRHETVRAEGAWFLVNNEQISPAAIGELFVSATDITKVGLAGVVGRLDAGSVSAVGKAIRDDSALTRLAYSWGEDQCGSMLL
ncbi:RNA-directed DNA polymerase [Kocuria sediminis]|uniref:RNA-directed DNA polymerase n=1 Tax=Kocuria sediminis TaxID=1038857 RepID=UPI001390BA85